MKRIAKRTYVLVLLCVVFLGLVAWTAWRVYTATYVFKGLHGPVAATVMPHIDAAQVDTFDQGSEQRIAVLITDPDSDWLGWVRAFKAHGIPARFTRDPAVAFRHHVVLVYPIVSGKAMSANALRGLANHIHSGNVVLAFELAGGGLNDVFGVSGYRPAKSREEIRWMQPRGIPREDVVRVNREEKLWTLGYSATSATVLARFDDDTAALTCNRQVGMACLMGLDAGRLIQMGMDGRAEPINRQYVNGYEPGMDVLVRWIRDLYLAQEPMPWRLSTVPEDKAVAMLPTHDVDYGPSVRNSLAFAKVLKDRDVSGTFFFQTKYRRDYNDEVFFDPDAVKVMHKLVDMKMELGSHTVAHSRQFEHMPLGTGREQYPDYRPFVKARGKVTDGTVLGELRISKYLIESLSSAQVVSFRPGYLSYPFVLPEALAATGYRYSSSLTANRTLTHLPYQMTVGRAGRALAPVFEFPVTIEDEAQPPLGERFDQAQEVMQDIARNQGLAVLLNHPDITGHKLDFERRWIDAWRERAWIGNLETFGQWWAARDQVDINVVREGKGWVLEAHSPLAIRGLVVHLPKAPRKKVRLDLAAGETVRIAL